MNTSTRIQSLLILILSVVLSSCSRSHCLMAQTCRSQVLRDFEQKQRALPNGNLFAIFSDTTLTVSERESLMFLYAYMPIGDMTDYSGEYYLANVRLSEQACREMPWGEKVTDELFRHFVLPIRVNNESLDESRKVFYEELKDRVKGLSMKDAILEVNHWCHEKVVYRPSDARTSSPLASVKTAYGRCGEESTFTVAALRSVGIPARQVYTPRWAHTDDNHAWVEAWADGEWYFMGACEPEPVLNLGWFNAPASRGMLMHTKVFGRYNGPEEIMLSTRNYTEINVTSTYAPTSSAVVTVVDTAGRPVSGAQIDFKVYNYAEFYTVATKYADASGQTSLTAGRGDMLVWASHEGRFGFAKLSFGKQQRLTIALDKKEGDSFAEDIDILPPPERALLPAVTSEQRAANEMRLAQEDEIRNKYVATFPTKEEIDSIVSTVHNVYLKEAIRIFLSQSRGNYDVLIRFLKEAEHRGNLAKGVALLTAISEKDLRDVSYEVLMDHFVNTKDVSSAHYEQAVMRKTGAIIMGGSSGWDVGDILNPRVAADEALTAYKAFFQSQFSKTEVDSFRRNTQLLVEWVKKHITVDETNNSQRIPISPVGVWRARVADAHSRDIFFVALARSMDIVAMVNGAKNEEGDAHVDVVMFANPGIKRTYSEGTTENEGDRTEVDFESDKPAETFEESLLMHNMYWMYDGDKPIERGNDEHIKYYKNFTISKLLDGKPELIDCDENNPSLRNRGRLRTGYYLLTTGTRLASGGVLARISSFNMIPHPDDDIHYTTSTKLPFHLRDSGEKVAVIGDFNSESLFAPVDNAGKKQSLLQTCGRGYFVVGVLAPGQEPTNHALRDIAALQSDLEKWGRKMVLLFPDEAQYKKFRPSEFPSLPSTVVYGIDTDGICRQMIENMKLKQENSLPVFIIADTFNRVVFVSQGYTIGLGEQLMKTIRGL